MSVRVPTRMSVATCRLSLSNCRICLLHDDLTRGQPSAWTASCEEAQVSGVRSAQGNPLSWQSSMAFITSVHSLARASDQQSLGVTRPPHPSRLVPYPLDSLSTASLSLLMLLTVATAGDQSVPVFDLHVVGLTSYFRPDFSRTFCASAMYLEPSQRHLSADLSQLALSPKLRHPLVSGWMGPSGLQSNWRACTAVPEIRYTLCTAWRSVSMHLHSVASCAHTARGARTRKESRAPLAMKNVAAGFHALMAIQCASNVARKSSPEQTMIPVGTLYIAAYCFPYYNKIASCTD